MKRILMVAIGVMLTQMVNAQKSLLSIDEHNKYIFYQVVEMHGFSADSLGRNAYQFIKNVYPKNKTGQKNKDGAIALTDKFLTYTSFVKHENGEMVYTLNIECKDQKYRYWLTDFTFTPYERDRYGNFVPKPGITVPIENASSKFDKKEVEGYLNQTGTFSKELGDKLKLYMLNAPAPKKEEVFKKVVTDKW